MFIISEYLDFSDRNLEYLDYLIDFPSLRLIIITFLLFIKITNIL